MTTIPVIAQQCSPLSSLSCPEIVKSLPVVINFDGIEGGLQDRSGVSTGFTMVDNPSTPQVTPTFSNIPGYEPSKLEILAGKLNLTTTTGIAHLNRAQSSGTNSQVNALGVGFVAPSQFSIQSTLANPAAGTGKSEQGGLWFGLDEDNYVKFVVLSTGNGNSKIEMRKEVAAMSATTDAKGSASMLLSSSLVNLKLVVNKVTNIVEGFYSINGGTEVSVGTLSIPSSFTAGKTLSDGITQNIVFGGVFGTHRSATTPVTYSFEDLKIEAIELPKSIVFTQPTLTVSVPQGSSKSFLDYIATADNSITNASLKALDDAGNTPTWLSVNGFFLDGINYTTGSEITFDVDATNLSIGSYSATVIASAPGYNNGLVTLMLTVTSGSSGALTNLKVNFQNASTIPPSGWVRDFGQPFGPRSLPYQGSGASYGWIKRADNTPLDLTKNARLRNSPADILQATFIHMQGNHIANFTGTPIEGIWEAQVANGYYDVTVSVGDGTEINSKHYINIEGVNAIVNFIPTTALRFKTATISVSVTDGLLTIDAKGGNNTKINWVTVRPTSSTRPSVVLLNPENGSQNVSENVSVSSNILNLPNGGINNITINSTNVFLTEEGSTVKVPANVNGTGGGDAITLVPTSPLKLSTTYVFNITDGVTDLSGASFIPYSSSFTTGSASTTEIVNARFDKINLPNTVGRHSSLTVGPDGKLYALTIDGIIKRFVINADGTLGAPELLYSLQDASGTRQQRLSIGFAFDPAATATNLIAYVTNSSFVFLNAPDWDGKLTKLSGNNLETVQDVVINLPRSVKDHLSNSIAFGPDGALYFTQGSSSGMGKGDHTWGFREEHLLSGAVLRLDLQKLTSLPLNVLTSEGGGTYNPYDINAPLTIYASGTRNAYDLVWHSNGKLYVPVNGSAAGGNTPASVPGTLRPDGSTYNGPAVPSLTDVQQTQKDFLFRVENGGYYGHPNPLRGEYVMFGGNPTSSIDPAQVDEYPVGTLPDANFRGYSFDFQTNKSANGIIEYKSNAFDGALKGKLLVVRYSQNDDIITLGVGANNDIVSSNEGVSIQGFSGFVDPLDLIEHQQTGNIYVSEYGGDGKITLLRPKTADAVIGVTPSKIYDNEVSGGTPGVNRVITISNSGAGALSITGIGLTGSNPDQFILSGLPSFPASINGGGLITFNVAFNPSSIGIKSVSVKIESNDFSTPSVFVPVRGLGTVGLGGSNEPSLQSILDLRQIPVIVGDDDISTTVIHSNVNLQKTPLLGQEVAIQRFIKAGDGNVTIEPLSVFGPTNNNPIVGMGWYISGDINSKAEVFTVSNSPLSNGQTVNVNVEGTLSFDPLTASFGFYSRWPFFGDRHLYSEDIFNTFSGSIPHHVRVYPYKDETGTVLNTYIIAFEENTSGIDYQDLVFIVRNVKPSTEIPKSNSLLFVENLDKFPSNNDFVTARIQIPWSSDGGVVYNANHDTVKVRIHNKGVNPLIVNNIVLSNKSIWKFLKLKGVAYDSATAFPFTVASGTFADLTLQFIAVDQGTRVKVLNESLTIVSNDDKYPTKVLALHGLWQYKGEGNNEPFAQEIINAFGFKTTTGFVSSDPDNGNPLTPKGDEIIPSYFVRADNSKPVSLRQMNAYHSCCNTGETITWYAKGTTTQVTVFRHIGLDGQTLLPRKSSTTPAEGLINPTTPFGLKVAGNWTDATKNPGKKIAFRVWKAIDPNGNLIPNTYIIANDYLGSTGTNYDYNDNMFYITNVKPEIGSVHYSALSTTPSAVDFEEKVLQTTNILPLTLKSLGQTYANGSADPALVISSVQITGENKAEFSASMPVKTTLNPQETTTLTVTFTPQTQGLKIADLLIHYNNSLTPHRVPLYGIAKASGTTVTAHYRINSGSSNPITINGKTWSADNQYSFDNLEPYSNSALSQIAGTDEDALYLREQSSNGDKKPFRYEIPVPVNGEYVVRLHFAELVWGAAGNGLTGGAGSRVMSVSLENQLRLINLDVAQEVGAATALVKNIPVIVTDGKLNINFSATINRPMVNAIEVYSLNSSGSVNSPVIANFLGLRSFSPELTQTVAVSSSSLPYDNGSTLTEAERSSTSVFVSQRQIADSKNDFEKAKVYPNPIHRRFNIEFPSTYAGNFSVQIVDQLGKVYQISKSRLKAGGTTMDVDISNLLLKPGSYSLRIYSDTRKTEIIKLIIL